jgi:hypothetical protein
MSSTRPQKWKFVEGVVSAIERSLNTVQGTKIVPNASVPERVGETLRQVDIFVEIPTGPRALRVAIEVRDKQRPLDLPEVEGLVAKLRKLNVDYGCIVSSDGFTASAKEEASRNRIELRTLSDIDSPIWWRASSMSLELCQVELLHWQANFRPEELKETADVLVGIDGPELEMRLESGETGTLPAFISAQGVEAIERPELTHLKDQETFSLDIRFENLRGASLRCPRGPLPLPQNVLALFRVHYRMEAVDLAAYQASDGVNAFSGVSTSWGKQVTVVAKLLPDGSRALTFAWDDPSAPKTAIVRRDEPPN